MPCSAGGLIPQSCQKKETRIRISVGATSESGGESFVAKVLRKIMNFNLGELSLHLDRNQVSLQAQISGFYVL